MQIRARGLEEEVQKVKMQIDGKNHDYELLHRVILIIYIFYYYIFTYYYCKLKGKDRSI